MVANVQGPALYVMLIFNNKNKIYFSVFWKSNLKAWMLKQLLPNLFNKTALLMKLNIIWSPRI